MAILTLAPQYTWFDATKASRENITQIDIVDRYEPNGNEISWDASDDKDGTVMCYVIGSQLIIAGDGTGHILANPDSYMVFSTPTSSLLPRFVNLTTINGLALLDTGSVTTLYGAFYGCAKLLSIKGAEEWDVSLVTTLKGMCKDCASLTELDLNKWGNKTSNVKDISLMCDKCLELKKVRIGEWDVSSVEVMTGVFRGNSYVGDMKLVDVDVSKWGQKTANVIKAGGFFYGCGRLKSIDLNGWNTSNMKDINHFFCDCFELIDIKISQWDVSNVELAYAMFNDCKKVKVIDLSGWKTRSMRTINQMFEGCASLERIIGIEQFDTSAFDINTPVYDCITGEELGFYAELDETFYNCYSLKELDLSSFNTKNVGYFRRMICNCHNLKSVYVGDNWSTESAKKSDDMSLYCYNLKGENGTAYQQENVTHEYAKVDGEDGTPGYFTHIENRDEEVLVSSRSLNRAAKAIRNKLGTTQKYLLSEFESAINSIGT